SISYFRSLMHRKLSRPFALENATSIYAHPAVCLRWISSQAHQASSRDKIAVLIDCRYRMMDGQCGEPFAEIIEDWSGGDHKRTDTKFNQALKDCVKILRGIGVQDMER